MSWEKRAHWDEIRQTADTLAWYVETWNELWPGDPNRSDAGLPGPWAQELASETAAFLATKAVAVSRLAERMHQAANNFERVEDTSTTSLRAIEDDPALLDG